jgi:hypothetical protein
MTEKLAAKWRLVSDPFAPESVWLPACAADSSGGLSANDHKFKKSTTDYMGMPTRSTALLMASLVATLRLSAALLLSAAFAYVAYMAVQLGFDWGYKLVERMFGQTAQADQAVTASYALVIAVIPCVFGLVFSFFKSALSGTRRWHAAYIIATLSYSTVVCLPNNVHHLFSSLEELLPVIFGLMAGLIGSSTGAWIYGALRKRMRLVPVVLSGLAALLPMVLYVLLSPMTLVVGLAIYSISIIMGSACAAYFASPRDRVGAILMAMVALLPIILVNFGNVTCNLISLGLDNLHVGFELGWRALLSACLISLWTFVCAGIGGSFGYKFRTN